MITGRVRRKGDAKRHLDKLRAAMRGPGRVHAGFPEGKVDGDIIDRAFFNEFGTEDIPERPFMRITMAENKRDYANMMRRGGRRIMQGKTTKGDVLHDLGRQMVDDIQDTIRSSVPPPNAPATVEHKGHDTTLVETGAMHDAVTYVIEDD
jgi:hypothetical protein